ncbi:MAG TPA: 1,4-dihydroxy-2-naphthoate polyprenyltransferase [Dermatophilaceae bacterium]|nr:1,4-dihydroxy-2-naphthoate polyprenyltransferase [Dermatophilaceae bacterium]
MATRSQWVAGARPRTLPAAVAPVVIGTGAAYGLGRGDPAAAVLALLLAVLLQVGVNYANDYSDGIRGTDHERVGPVRLVGQRLAPAASVRLAAILAFAAAAVVGLSLVALSQVWVLLPVGAAAILAAWFYTGGSRPYGYLGLGEVFVFVFFGLVATLGTTSTQAHRLSAGAWAGAVGIGAISTALLVANNLRDIPGDTAAGKLTLAVRLGDRGTRWLYAGLLAVSAGAVAVLAGSCAAVLLAVPAFVLAWPPIRLIATGARGPSLVPALGGTARYALAYALLLGIALALC